MTKTKVAARSFDNRHIVALNGLSLLVWAFFVLWAVSS